MISRKQCEDLIGDYEHVQRLMNEAGHILEDQSLFAVEVTGHFGATSSKSLINAVNDTYANLIRAIAAIYKVMPAE